MRSCSASSWEFCHAILPRVSRTFALTIPILPEIVRDSVCVAYLLCRIADTVEDREDIDGALREILLYSLRGLVDNSPVRRDDVADFVKRWPAGGDRQYGALLHHTQDVVTAFDSLPVDYQLPIKRCLREMIGGMLATGAPCLVNGDVAYFCSDLEKLERYCHYVAGTVGLMLTRIFLTYLETRSHGPGRFACDRRLEHGRRFGLGLQLTNILKDVTIDRSRGVSYLPPGWCDLHGIIRPEARSRIIHRTLGHLDVALEYTLTVPVEAEGIRLFCLWCLWMAVSTLRAAAAVQGVSQAKISRLEVQRIVEFSRTHVHEEEKLREYHGALRQQTTDLIMAARG